MAEGIRLAVWAVASRVISYFARNETLAQFFRLPLAQQKALFDGLAVPHPYVSLQNSGSEPIHRNWRYSWQTKRQNFQLPCSVETRRHRADWIARRVGIHSRIVVLGDDDYLSVELCMRGFRHLEVADCDPLVLGNIKKLTRAKPCYPLSFEGDFQDETFLKDRSPDLICIDPPYNSRWARIFIRQAMRTAGRKQNVILMMMVNQKCFSDVDLQEINRELSEYGFVLKETVEGFNSYPMRGLSKFFLRMGINILADTKVSGRLEFRSDLLVFERGSV
ncbi:MAG: putative methyltransferase [Proteobacteria bacterium]|nr:MAG: putative methyltransferase [Pseudomonadota bacterium]